MLLFMLVVTGLAATLFEKADAFNVTNHTQFGGLGTSLANLSAFGKVTKQNNSARDWQFAGKFNF